MAKAATQRRSSPRQAHGSTPKATKRSAQASKKAGSNGRRVAKPVKPSPRGGVSAVARAAALKTLKTVSRKVLEAGAGAVRSAADRTASVGKSALEAGLSRRVPIQVSIDVAVPLAVAWQEWMTFDSLTDGVHRTEDVKRDGDYLIGRTAAPRSTDWEAEIVDEREQEAFAWRSTTGSDCAGLVTFHRLSDRLTRIELDLDVLPTSPGETLALSLHVAHHRAEAELRLFKARVEFINPDVYEAEIAKDRNGREPKEDQ